MSTPAPPLGRRISRAELREQVREKRGPSRREQRFIELYTTRSARTWRNASESMRLAGFRNVTPSKASKLRHKPRVAAEIDRILGEFDGQTTEALEALREGAVSLAKRVVEEAGEELFAFRDPELELAALEKRHAARVQELDQELVEARELANVEFYREVSAERTRELEHHDLARRRLAREVRQHNDFVRAYRKDVNDLRLKIIPYKAGGVPQKVEHEHKHALGLPAAEKAPPELLLLIARMIDSELERRSLELPPGSVSAEEGEGKGEGGGEVLHVSPESQRGSAEREGHADTRGNTPSTPSRPSSP